jgi:hypothetical protein
MYKSRFSKGVGRADLPVDVVIATVRVVGGHGFVRDDAAEGVCLAICSEDRGLRRGRGKSYGWHSVFGSISMENIGISEIKFDEARTAEDIFLCGEAGSNLRGA